MRWGGLRVAGLCIGVDEYAHIAPLGNAVRDAEAFNKKLKSLGIYQTGADGYVWSGAQRWNHADTDQFTRLKNSGNAELIVMERGDGGRCDAQYAAEAGRPAPAAAAPAPRWRPWPQRRRPPPRAPMTAQSAAPALAPPPPRC